MAVQKGSRRKPEDEDVDLGIDKNEIDETELIFDEFTKETQPDGIPVPGETPTEVIRTLTTNTTNAYVDMSRVVEDDDEVRFKGTIKAEDMPVCPCCGAAWSLNEGMLMSPGCGCAIHPPCGQCSCCEAHCKGHRK